MHLPNSDGRGLANFFAGDCTGKIVLGRFLFGLELMGAGDGVDTISLVGDKVQGVGGSV